MSTTLSGAKYDPATNSSDPSQVGVPTLSQNGSSDLTWVNGYILLGIICQLALLSESIGPFRVIVRSSTFLSSVVLLILVPGRMRTHSSQGWALAALGIVTLQLLNTDGNGIIAGVAQCGLYLAVLAPLFWGCRLNLKPNEFRQIIMLIWGFQMLSSVFGVLQVYYPGSFQGNTAAVLNYTPGYLDSLKIKLADGQTVFRPMGLTDAPGGASGSGMICILFGLAFLIFDSNRFVKFVSGLGIIIGFFCIYLSQVRVALVLTLICCSGFALILFLRGELRRAAVTVCLFFAALIGGYVWSVNVGGASVTERISTLTDEAPGAVYYKNRGTFLEYTVDYAIPNFPFGAGLGRWGMIYLYFGDRAVSPLWVEIQWTAWVFDGGVPLVVAYAGAILVACWITFRIALRTRDVQVSTWSSLVFAYNIGSIALTFSYPLFVGQSGADFWLLNACLFSMATRNGRESTVKNSRPFSLCALEH